MATKSTAFSQESFFDRLKKALGWTQASYWLMGTFVLTVILIIYIWWPLAEEYLAQVPWDGDWWRYMDLLLLGNFAFMSLMLMAGADIRKDFPIIFVGLAGGLVIESWGTQTELWTYYTFERPPLWIIPAWPIASLTIDRMVRIGDQFIPEIDKRLLIPAYWMIFAIFSGLMLIFVMPTIGKSLTIMALIMCALLIASPKNYRIATLTFLMGSGLGYFLELWGTTRLCWTYYTLEYPPVFAVLAHGMAAVAFWRVKILGDLLWAELQEKYRRGSQQIQQTMQI